MIRSKIFPFFMLIMIGGACRKSNNSPPAAPNKPDSLLNWNVISILPGKSLVDIWFTSGSRGFTLADEIYETRDGGVSWTGISNTLGMQSLSNLFFVNAQTGFAQGVSQLATTVDGGNTWAVKTLPSTSVFTVFFVDSSEGYFGDGTGLKKTTNAGNGWVTNFSEAGGLQAYYPFFLNSDTGFVATGSGRFAATFDGGQTWQIKTTNLSSSPFPNVYNQLFFLDRSDGFYACPSGIFKTTDGGQSWQNVFVDSANPIGYNTVNVIKFVDANTGYYKGLSAIYKSSDGGQTWDISCKLGSDHFIGMYFLDIHTGWACTANGRILKIQQ